MSRYQFGGTAADLGVTVAAGGSLLTTPNTYLRFWTTRTGGTEYTDFLDEVGVAIAAGAWRTESTGEFPLFSGPDTVQFMWCGNATDTSKRIKVFAHADQVLAGLNTGGAGTAPTAEKTTSYTAAVGDFVPVDLSAGNATIALPNAPADKTQIAIQVVAVSTGVVGAYAATINRGGTDTFKRTTGPTSLTMTQLEHTLVLQYKASTKIWYVVSGNRASSTDLAIYAAAYAPLGVNDQYFAGGTTDVVIAGLPIDELYHPAAATYTDAVTAQLVPNLASGTVVYTIADWNPSTNTPTVIGTMTLIAAGGTVTSTSNTRAARLVFNSGTSYTVAAGHFLRYYCSAANGTGYWGQGPMLHLRQSGTFTLPSAPTAPSSAPTATSGTGQVTLAQALTTGAAEMLYVDTGAAQPVARTQGASYIRTGLTAGTSTTYATVALAPWTASTISPNTSAVGPSAGGFTSFGTDGTWDAAGIWTPTLGTNSGVSASVASGILTEVSGAIGNNAAQDKIWSTFSAETGTGANVHSAWRAEDIKVALGSSSDFWELYFSCDAFVSLSTTMTHFLQFQMNAVGIRVGYKAGGSFTKLSETGNSALTFLGTSTDASGQIHYSATQTTDGAHYYGVGFEALLIDGTTGTQTINVYSGSEAQADLGFGGSGMPLIATILVPSAVRAAIPAGYCAFQKLGTQSATAVAQTTRFKGPNTMKITPLSPKGA